MINKRAFTRLKKHLLAEPRRYDQNDVLSAGQDIRNEEVPPCGTTGCLLGWASFLSAKNKKERGTYSFTRARKYLGLGVKTAKKLFAGTFSDGWNFQSRNAYNNAITPEERVKVAIEVIDNLIKSNGRNF